jgi:predicted DNA-binding transcriptional regulator YafY
MGKKLAYERYYWFHGQVKAGHYPNARKLSERFEISEKQAQRDIEFIRDRLSAPLLYNPDKRGYEFGDDGYELPPIWFNEDELLALCLALRLAATIPDRQLKNSLCELLEKFLSFRFLASPPSLTDIKEKVSVKNIEYYRVKEEIFHQVMDSLFHNEAMKISYYSPHKRELTERVIQPLHLLSYMGSWHLIAFCTLKEELRDFSLSRIRTIGPASGKIHLPPQVPPIKEYLRKNFGLMSGNESIEVCLRFAPGVAEWISEQVWHAGQEAYPNEDGSICLKFPVADFREVRGEILKYGANVEVLSPLKLRDEIKNEIEKMSRLYR